MTAIKDSVKKQINNPKHFSVFFVCCITGVLGFVLETVFCFFFYGRLQDRGFLTLPICPIYSIIIFANYCINIKVKVSVRGLLCYCGVVTIIITIYEELSGQLLQLLGINLWNYSGSLPLSFKYISLPVSVAWGILGTAYIFYVVPFLSCISTKIKNKQYFTSIVVFVLIADYLFTFIRIAINGMYVPLY